MDKEQKLNLKIQALLERVSELTTGYENKNADLRVELTLMASERDAIEKQLQELFKDHSEDQEEDTPTQDSY